MTPLLAAAVVPALRLLDPECAHRLAMRALAAGYVRGVGGPDNPRLAVEALGRRFANPIGLAAGFDKDVKAVPGLAGLGFGFLEIGTVTPRPQQGNPRPRLFRLGADRAVINRMGFNNAGLAAVRERLGALPSGLPPLGANVGINKDGADPLRDYPALVAALGSLADYIVLNVSSPNTPGLRDLQAEDRLRAILTAIRREVPDGPPLLVKLAPDLADETLPGIVEVCAEEGLAGLIVSNTTLARPPVLRSRARTQDGGLSGVPLMGPSTRLLARVAGIASGRLLLIGVGGIASGMDVLAKLRAGATLVQVYTAFAYEGPGLVVRLKRELVEALDRGGYPNVAASIGAGIGADPCDI